VSATVDVLKLQRVICRHSTVANFNLPHLHFGASVGGDPGRVLPRPSVSENWSPWAIMRHPLHDPTFSHFSRIPTCGKQTDRQTHNDGMHIWYTVLIWRCAVKTVRCATIVPWCRPTLHFTTNWALSPSCAPPVGGFGGGLHRLWRLKFTKCSHTEKLKFTFCL